MGKQAEFIGGELCLDYANAVSDLFAVDSRSEPERYRDLVVWSRRAESLPPGALSRLLREAPRRQRDLGPTLRRARRLGQAIRGAFRAIAEGARPSSRDLGVLNDEISRAFRMLRIVPGPGGASWGWAEEPGRFDQVLWPIARSAATLIASERARRVRLCASETCQWLFIDASRNGRRRWCDMKVCGNRTKMRRFRSRRRKSAGKHGKTR